MTRPGRFSSRSAGRKRRKKAGRTGRDAVRNRSGWSVMGTSVEQGYTRSRMARRTESRTSTATRPAEACVEGIEGLPVDPGARDYQAPPTPIVARNEEREVSGGGGRNERNDSPERRDRADREAETGATREQSAQSRRSRRVPYLHPSAGGRDAGKQSHPLCRGILS